MALSFILVAVGMLVLLVLLVVGGIALAGFALAARERGGAHQQTIAALMEENKTLREELRRSQGG